VKNPVLPHGASSDEKASWAWGLTPQTPRLAIHPGLLERGILAFSRKPDDSTWAYVIFSGRPEGTWTCRTLLHSCEPGQYLMLGLYFIERWKTTSRPRWITRRLRGLFKDSWYAAASTST